MNLTLLKQEAREDFATLFRFVHFKDCANRNRNRKTGVHPKCDCSAADNNGVMRDMVDTLLDRCVEEMEKAVVPEERGAADLAPYYEGEAAIYVATGRAACRTAVVEAFAKFRGV